MPEIHLRQAGFTYRACRLFTKSKDRIRQVKKSRSYIYQVIFTSYIYQNELDKARFNMVWFMKILKI